MTHIINAPGDRGDPSAGWAVAVIILLVVIAGIAFWYTRYRGAPAPTQGPGATVQINVPTGGNSADSGGGGGAPPPVQ